MNLPVLCTPLDGVIGTLATAYVPNVGAPLVLTDASRLAAVTPSPASPVRLTVLTPQKTVLSQFLAKAQPAGNIVAVALDAGFSDVTLPAGSLVAVTASAAALREIQDAILDVVGAVSTLSTADIAGLGSAATRPASDFLSPTGSGAGLTSLNGSAISTGIVPAARLGAGSPSGSTYLRGDGQWSSPPPAPVLSVAGKTGTVSLSTADVSGIATVATTGAYGDLTGRPMLGSLAALNGIGGLLSAGTGIALSGGGETGSPVSISATGGGGSATPGGSSGQLQVNSNGAFSGSAALAAAPTTNNPLVVTLDNTDYHSVNGSNSLIKLNNPNFQGQNVIASVIDGRVVSKWRTDFQGSVNWIADGPNGGHHFFVGGDFNVGTDALTILPLADVVVNCTTNSGFSVKAAGYQLRDLIQFLDNSGNIIASIGPKGEFRPASLADGAAVAASLYYSTTAGKLAYKDPSGTVHPLY